MAKTVGGDDDVIDHYAILGLPSGKQGSKLSVKAIKKAYRVQSRARHPDKRPDDPDATADFQRLNNSFEILKDPKARAAYDASLRAPRNPPVKDSAGDAKRQKIAADLDERERAAAKAKANGPNRFEEWKKMKTKEELDELHTRLAFAAEQRMSSSKLSTPQHVRAESSDCGRAPGFEASVLEKLVRKGAEQKKRSNNALVRHENSLCC